MRKLILLTALAVSSVWAHARDVEMMQAVLPNFREITPAIYAGPNAVSKFKGFQGIDALNKFGIVHHINLQGGDVDGSFFGFFAYYLQKGEMPEAVEAERQYVQSTGRYFSNFPLNSHAPVDAETDLRIREALLLLASATPESPAYIHCEHGADRTGLIIALYRIVYQRWNIQEAYREWVKFGHTAVARLVTGDMDVYFFDFLKKEGFMTPPSCANDLLTGS
jgi:hypothetical protein